MTSKQKRKVIALLQEDCQIKEKYIENGKTCAIGCLALAAGATEKELLEYNTQFIYTLPLIGVAGKISDMFGLTLWELRRIQDINDNAKDDVDSRRREVVCFVENLPTLDRP